MVQTDSPAPTVGLALSGGVMRGATHLGVLAALEAAGIGVDCVAGSSAGALVGALYCAGLSVAKITELAAATGWRNVAGLTWPGRGFVSFAKMEAWLVKTLGDLRFADLKRPLAVVATDLERGRPVMFTAGRLAPTVRASCSVPGFVTPVELEGRLLGDGGVSNNLPVSAVRELGADYVIGVDLFIPVVRRRLGPFGFGLAAIETLVRRSGGGVDAADCLISPALAGVSYFSTSHNEQLIALGKSATRQVLPAIQAALGSG
ncbi:MAG: patatin-like phospholipase family protein [Anaerolineae bacterium]